MCPAEAPDFLCFSPVLGSRLPSPCSANPFRLHGGLLLYCPCEGGSPPGKNKPLAGISAPHLSHTMAILPPHVQNRSSVAVQAEERSGPIMETELADKLGKSPSAAVSKDLATAAMLMTIEASRTSLVTRIDTLPLECGLMWQDLDKICGRLGSAEIHISDVEDSTSTHNRSDDAENRLCRNNVRMVGLPEGVKGVNPATFAEAFLK